MACCGDVLYRLDPRKIRVISGDVEGGYWELQSLSMVRSLKLFKEADKDSSNVVSLDNAIEKLEIVNIENAHPAANIAGVAVGAWAGLRVFGPLGAIIGAVGAQALVGNRQEMTVEVQLVDGRKFVASMDTKLYKRFQALKARSSAV